ncbi:glycosyltransferase family 2 protein [Candidatus Pacearchaeota archaeon]|nr:glycosyltransferase family 2 protein [Candidatus Pacearchaeota archaeon]
MPKISIVLPVFNEEKNIKLIVEKYSEIAKKIDIEVIFVEDSGSQDKTRDELAKYAKKNRFMKNLFTTQRGYGISIYNGLKESKGEFLCWTHADLQTDPQDTIKAYNLMKNSKNPQKTYVKGKRYGRPILDTLINTLGMSIFETFVLGQKLYDINAQPNLFHHSFLKLMRDPPHDFSFDLYSYYLARKNGYEIKRLPVFFGKRIHGKSAWNTGMKARFKFIKRTIKFTFELKKKLKQ